VREGATVDLDATMDATSALVDAGVTDFRTRWGRSGDPAADEDHLTALAQTFHTTFDAP
jgi:hypothetical protein